MKLEGIDPQHPSMYFILTVAEVSWNTLPMFQRSMMEPWRVGGEGMEGRHCPASGSPDIQGAGGGVHWNIGKSKREYWRVDEKPWNTTVTE